MWMDKRYTSSVKIQFQKNQLLPAGLYKTKDLLYTNEVIKKSIASGDLNWT